MTGLNFGDAASQDIRGAVQFLKTRSGKVGVTGFCMGGALTLLAVCMTPEIDAAVVWYGCPPLEYIDATKIKAPLQAHWATQDEFFPIATVDQLQEKLREARVTFDFHRYLAHHAFANETAAGLGSDLQLLRPLAQLRQVHVDWRAGSMKSISSPKVDCLEITAPSQRNVPTRSVAREKVGGV